MAFTTNISEAEYVFLARARSTLALQTLWSAATAAQGAVLGMFELSSRDDFSRLSPTHRERLLRIATTVLSRCDVRALPWMHNHVVFLGAPDEMATLQAALVQIAEQEPVAATQLRGYVTTYYAAHSMTDQCDRLTRAMQAEPPEGVSTLEGYDEPTVGLTVACSYAHHFLCNLVAKNRHESVESVLREAVALYLSTMADTREPRP